MTAFLLSKSALTVAAPLVVGAVTLLCRLVMGLVNTIRRAELLKVSLQAVSAVRLPEAGTVQIHLEGPRMTRAFNGLKYQLVTPNGAILPITPTGIRSRSAGMETVRELYGDVWIPESGTYELCINGLNTQQPLERCRVVFTRPYTAVVVLYILGIVFTGIACIGGIVLSCLVLARP